MKQEEVEKLQKSRHSEVGADQHPPGRRQSKGK
jgi:hypothetical protein